VGVDSVWEQEKPEARKMLAADWASERQANIAQPKRVSAGHPQRQVHAVLGAFELQRTSSFAGTSFDYDLRMRDYICNDLDNKKNKQNNPVWHRIILPSHYHKSIVHRHIERDIWCQ
jgi:hypothetical protein